jgi:hypothetical protein
VESLQVRQRTEVTVRSPPALVHASQHVLGSGDESVTWLVEVQRAEGMHAPLLFCTQSAIPWLFQAWLHTLRVTVDGRLLPLQEVCGQCCALQRALLLELLTWSVFCPCCALQL